MPVLKNSTYRPSLPFKNKHLNTVYRSVFNKFPLNFKRDRLELPDGDFIDLDISSVRSKKAVIAIHGLEGSSTSTYILSLAQVLNKNGFDLIAINLRGCSGESNRLLNTYHSGKTEDLEAVVTYIEKTGCYEELFLVGYSLGGNLCLKFLGEGSAHINKIKAAVGVSVPCDLRATSEKMNAFSNKLYLHQFLKSLKIKAFKKMEEFPDSFLKKEDILSIKNFKDFDNFYTAPAHGFKDAEDYYKKANCKQFLPLIKTPALLINALDDPFFTESCYPVKEALENSHFFLEAPDYGGHVGFCSYLNPRKNLWSENRILSFLKDQK